ncbi:phosphomevalonate kinase, peroxisomal-like [Primulina eburnea]|uniref:phosphomevalonate kinase, peroxisomal-like n=1 Tax=Primulina eburnea TaxID=1245227 RepID=UPI003C6C2B23
MAVVASAPGKVLMTGGYLILERPNAGIVLSTNARFYAIVKPLYDDIKPNAWAWSWTDVKLASPQMARETMYKLSLENLVLQCVNSSDSRNPFVEYALQYAIAAAHVHKLVDLSAFPDRESMWYLEVMEAFELFYQPMFQH